RSASLAAERAQQQVFLDRKARKQAPSFRYECNAEIDYLLGSATDEIVSLPVNLRDDAAAARAYDAHHAFHQGALAVAVGPEKHHGSATADMERHVLQHPHGAIGRVDLLYGEAIGQDMPSPLRDRARRRPGRHRRSSCPRPARPAAARTA